VTCVFNATPVPRDLYSIGVAAGGEYRKIFDSDEVRFGGSGYNRQSNVMSSAGGDQGSPYALKLNLPPLGAMFFVGPN
jgi:1,4-alpha-glucan branching enzyme